jgi:hypothetical protein
MNKGYKNGHGVSTFFFEGGCGVQEHRDRGRPTFGGLEKKIEFDKFTPSLPKLYYNFSTKIIYI